MFSNIFQPYTYSKLEILYEFDVRFHTKVRKSNLSCFTDCTNHSSAGALIHRQQTIYWIFTQTKLSSMYRHKRYCHLLGLDKTSSVAYNSGETQTCNYYFFFLLFGRDRLWRNRRKRVASGGKLWSPETVLYPNISNWFFCCFMEKLLIFNICET